MRQMTVAEIQKVNLDILCHIKDFCEEHNIKFHLAYGTLLGAVRHHGFIPWDDDADIGMLRPDYDRFIREYKDSGKYKLCAPERRNSFLNYARLCEMKDTYFKQKYYWTFESVGVGVDILPIDNVPEPIDKFLKYAAEIVGIRDRLIAWRKSAYGLQTFRRDAVGFCKDTLHFLARKLRRLVIRFVVPVLLAKDRKLRTLYHSGTSKHCSHILGHRYPRKFWERCWLDEVRLVDFEHAQLPIPIGAHELLSAEYGDYMTIPPASERTVHSDWQTMWWRN